MKYDIKSIEKRKKKEVMIKNVLKVILILLIYNMILLGISAMDNNENINIFGFKSYIITTNSMEPNIRMGDAVICKKIKTEDLKEGDVITFSKDGESITITHRIIKIEDNNGKKSYITKGDNNTLEDNEKVEDSQIRGKMVIVIPRIGNFIKLSSNNIIVLILILVVLILWFMKILINEKIESRIEKRKIEEAKSKKY